MLGHGKDLKALSAAMDLYAYVQFCDDQGFGPEARPMITYPEIGYLWHNIFRSDEKPEVSGFLRQFLAMRQWDLKQHMKAGTFTGDFAAFYQQRKGTIERAYESLSSQ